MTTREGRREGIALFLPSLRGGGAERVMLNLAQGFVKRGFHVDLVLAKAEGAYLSEVPPEVRIVNLKASRVLWSLPGLIRYLRREQPRVMLSALSHANLVALWARAVARVKTRLVVSEHNTLSISTEGTPGMRAKLIPWLAKQFYPAADAIIAVSEGVAQDLIAQTGLPREKVRVIYNPVITPALFAKAKEPVEHPWFQNERKPVILGVGRLTEQKDFATLLRAFALVREKYPARLMILGEGEDRPKLEALARQLQLEEDVALPGFVSNPYKYMRRATVFVLSSRWEGLPTVLIEALALGTPVVATDCPSGPREILEEGRWGQLVPVGDVEALAAALNTALASKTDQNGAPTPKPVLARFALSAVVNQYLDVLQWG